MRRMWYTVAVKYNPDLWPACWVLQLIANGRLHDFYNSRQWKKERRKVIKAARCRCYDCERKSPAVLTPLRAPWEKPKDTAERKDTRPVATVHHVNELRQRPDLALSECDEAGRPNLVCLCPSCHWERHHKRPPEITPERW